MQEFDAWTGLVPRITATNFGVGRHLDPLSRAAFRAGVGRRQIRTFHHYLANALRCDPLHTEAEAALATELAHTPALTIFGERNDPFHFQREWRRRVPLVEQLVVIDGNHFPMCDDPTFVASAIARWHRNARISRVS